MSSPSLLPPLPRGEYFTNAGSAIIGHWRNNPAHPEHLVRLAHMYEDEDDPESSLSLAEMAELVSIFRDSAKWYVQRGIHDMDGSMKAEADHLSQSIRDLSDAVQVQPSLPISDVSELSAPYLGPGGQLVEAKTSVSESVP